MSIFSFKTIVASHLKNLTPKIASDVNTVTFWL